MEHTTRYAKSGEIHVAYQVFGEGPDLIMVPGFVSHFENYWDEPRLARWLNKLGGRLDSFAKPSVNGRYLRIPAEDRSRRIVFSNGSTGSSSGCRRLRNSLR